MLKRLAIPFCVIFLSVFNISCGGSGSGDSQTNTPETTALETGVFLDDPVGGVNYQTATQSGTTNAQGNYSYLSGETVTFSIGDIVFPLTNVAPIVTPLDMVGATNLTDTSLINIVRLLQSLDVDGDPTNGIEISSTAHAAATGLTISFDSPTFDADVANLVANSGSITTALIDETTAVDNFKLSLSTQTIDWENYYYLANNRQWNYTFTQGGAGSIYEYTTNGIANGQNVYIHGWSPGWSGTLEYFLQDVSSGLFTVGLFDDEGGGGDIFFASPVMLGCNNLYELCNIAGSVSGIDYDLSFINELDTANVPAGSFNDCIKITQTDNSIGGSQNRVMWYCRGAGQVRHEKVSDFVYELDSITTYTP